MEKIELRDFIAAAALAGLLAHTTPKLAESEDWISTSAYRYADAMLKAREEPGTPGA
jgi:hypothetical protein